MNKNLSNDLLACSSADAVGGGRTNGNKGDDPIAIEEIDSDDAVDDEECVAPIIGGTP